MTSTPAPLRFGTLGAAHITPVALVGSARHVMGAQVAAVAARDATQASAFAARHNIPRVHATYADLIADPEIDAIYNPLPNSHHAEWSIRALEAGKHVLCEKPFAANAAEAVKMAEAAAATGLVLMEAFHYRYHPLTLRLLEILHSGEIGQVRHIATAMCIPNYKSWDIRWRYDLAGGALMDVGCYAIHLLRTLAGSEPTLTNAQAWLRTPLVDREIKADFTFAGGVTGHIHCSMWSPTLLHIGARIVGELGEITVRNPFVPQFYHRITTRTAAGVRHESVTRTPTYRYQLEAFVAAVQHGAAFPTNTDDAVANMQVIDAIYTACGLPLRQGTLDKT